jgi:hypothetical protein
MEAKLFAMELPASGSIYYSHDLPPTMPRIDIPGFDNGLCIGPYAHSVWWYGERKDLDIDRGPHTNPQHVLRSFADKELAWIHAHGRPRYPFDREYMDSFEHKKQDPQEHANSLKDYLSLIPYLVPTNSTAHTPTLRHPDLSPNNILITDDLIITGFIDWQHAMVLPAWLTAGIPPAFENHADEGSRGLQIPKLPDDLQSMDKSARARAEEQYRRRHIHFWYLALTQKLNEQHWRAYMGHDGAFITRNMFLQAGVIWQGNNAHLQIDLSQVVRNWSVFASPSADGSIPTCPVVIEEQEMQRRENLRISLQEGDVFTKNMSEAMGVLPDGSVSHENFHVSKERESMIREGVLTKLKDDPFEAERVLLAWPFHDFDEDEWRDSVCMSLVLYAHLCMTQDNALCREDRHFHSSCADAVEFMPFAMSSQYRSNPNALNASMSDAHFIVCTNAANAKSLIEEAVVSNPHRRAFRHSEHLRYRLCTSRRQARHKNSIRTQG